MKRFALFAAILFAAGFGLQAITIGDTEVDLGADLRTRYQDFDGDDDYGDFGALDARWRLWASADITDSISAAIRLNVAEGELGSPGDAGDNTSFGFNGTNGLRAVEFAYVTWHNEWGDVHVGRVPNAMVGNDLLLDSFRYDGWSGAYEGAFVDFSDFGGWDLDLFYVDGNSAGIEDEGMGIGVVIGFGEMIGWDLSVGFYEADDDMTGTPGEEYTAMFANANIPLSDVAVLDLSWIDGDGGSTSMGGGGSTSQGNAFLARLDYEINEELGIHAAYGKVEPGAILDTGCSGSSSGVCGGFGWEPSMMASHGGIGSRYIGFPEAHDGSMISIAISWGENWTFSFIDWDDDSGSPSFDFTVLRLEHNVVF
ncbi:putative porin [bacterium]|nr:putative porin [bacterium]